MCWQSCARAALFFPLLFFPFRGLAGFSAERRWLSRQGPVAAAALALAGWPAASARALCHRPAGSYGHRECHPSTRNRQHTRIRRSAVTPFHFLQAAKPLDCKPCSFFSPPQRDPRVQCCGPGKSTCKYCK